MFYSPEGAAVSLAQGEALGRDALGPASPEGAMHLLILPRRAIALSGLLKTYRSSQGFALG